MNYQKLNETLLTDTQKTARELNDLNSFMAGPEAPKMHRPLKDLLYEEQRALSTLVQIRGKRLELQGDHFTHPSDQADDKIAGEKKITLKVGRSYKDEDGATVKLVAYVAGGFYASNEKIHYRKNGGCMSSKRGDLVEEIPSEAEGDNSL